MYTEESAKFKIKAQETVAQNKEKSMRMKR